MNLKSMCDNIANNVDNYMIERKFNNKQIEIVHAAVCNFIFSSVQYPVFIDELIAAAADDLHERLNEEVPLTTCKHIFSIVTDR